MVEKLVFVDHPADIGDMGEYSFAIVVWNKINIKTLEYLNIND